MNLLPRTARTKATDYEMSRGRAGREEWEEHHGMRSPRDPRIPFFDGSTQQEKVEASKELKRLGVLLDKLMTKYYYMK